MIFSPLNVMKYISYCRSTAHQTINHVPFKNPSCDSTAVHGICSIA